MERFLLIQYLTWQFIDSPKAIIIAWKNYLLFNLNYFSIPILLRTFFSHWHRYYYSYGRGFSPSRYFEAFTFNMMSRVIGAILRTVFIAVGILTEIFIVIIGVFLVLGWIVLPFILIYGIILGFKLIFF